MRYYYYGNTFLFRLSDATVAESFCENEEIDAFPEWNKTQTPEPKDEDNDKKVNDNALAINSIQLAKSQEEEEKKSEEKKYEADEHSDGKDDEKKNQPTKPAVKKKDSLSFSWSDNSNDSFMDVVKDPTPPPVKVMNEELFELLATLLEKTMQKPRAFYMTNGVPWEKWKILDWPKHVTPPSTLIEVRNNLDNEQYKTPGQFAEAVRTVFRNYTTYYWKDLGQYRVDTKAQLLWEEFNIEYFQILADESEERKREESRKRAIDEAQQMHGQEEQEFSKTHTPTVSEDEEEEEEEDPVEPVAPPLEKHVSFNGNVTEKEIDAMTEAEEKEVLDMQKMVYELSQHISLVTMKLYTVCIFYVNHNKFVQRIFYHEQIR